jgi:hypothetical protein
MSSALNSARLSYIMLFSVWGAKEDKSIVLSLASESGLSNLLALLRGLCAAATSSDTFK